MDLAATAGKNGTAHTLRTEANLVLAGDGSQLATLIARTKLLSESNFNNPELWLLHGDLLQAAGDSTLALVAWARAVTTAQCQGLWHGETSTPPELLPSVSNAISQIRIRRRELYFGSYEWVRRLHGADAVARVDRALTVHLREKRATPADTRQKPRFFHFPDLTTEPFLDPYSQPWAAKLAGSFAGIRQEALEILAQDAGLEDFVRVRTGDRIENYLAGHQPAWEAFFFYRHGKRYDGNHVRCPYTSQVLDSIDLCQISDHAPEICFSILSPGTVIRPHFGVTNVRCVMHLPLLIPPDCALHLLGSPPHVWREGELVMFDDTFEHEAWNHSARTRMILLMDCWNPFLASPERKAVSSLIETIAAVHQAAKVVG